MSFQQELPKINDSFIFSVIKTKSTNNRKSPIRLCQSLTNEGEHYVLQVQVDDTDAKAFSVVFVPSNTLCIDAMDEKSSLVNKSVVLMLKVKNQVVCPLKLPRDVDMDKIVIAAYPNFIVLKLPKLTVQ